MLVGNNKSCGHVRLVLSSYYDSLTFYDIPHNESTSYCGDLKRMRCFRLYHTSSNAFNAMLGYGCP